ncbi:MAG: NAD-binding protein [Nitrospiraceae bacterium]
MPRITSTARSLHRVSWSIAAVLSVVVAGTVGYVLIEGWSVFDALYMTITTVATVGFQEVHPLSEQGRVFTLGLIVSGVGTLLYVLGELGRVLIDGEVRRVLGQYRADTKVKTLNGHYIVCGYGRMGRRVVKELQAKPRPFLVIEKNPAALAGLADAGILAIEGDATQDEVLLDAGIERAKGLVSVARTDMENLYIVLTARGLNKDLYIVARAGEEGSEQKLLRAGANRVSSPYLIGGAQMAHALIRPAALDFLELATQSEHLDLQMEEFVVQDARFDGQTPCACGLQDDRGLMLVAVKRQSGHMEFNPGHDVKLSVGDTVIALGEPASLKRVEAIFRKQG